MAKKVYPGAAFEPCDNEVVPFAFDLFAQISLLAPLPMKAKENLEKCPGALRLRLFKKGELICRQGEEDCTAFYILKIEDILKLQAYPQLRSQQLCQEIAATAKKIVELEALVKKASVDGNPKDAEKTQKQIADLREKLNNWEKETDQLPLLAGYLEKLGPLRRGDRVADCAGLENRCG
jgi:hypothetical protein